MKKDSSCFPSDCHRDFPFYPVLLSFLFLILQTGVFALVKIGLSPNLVIAQLFASLAGSLINIP